MAAPSFTCVTLNMQKEYHDEAFGEDYMLTELYLPSHGKNSENVKR
jgi:hypothetical protein